jgi:iron complex transport system substrate-binding protein
VVYIPYIPPPPPTPAPTPIPIAGIDDAGSPFEFSAPPGRIVSHVPSITETLFALGLDEEVVGVSDYCDYPVEAQSKPSVGGYFDPSIEAMVGLDPDLVLTDGHVPAIAQLEGLGIPFVVIQPSDIEGVLEDITLLGYITGTEQNAEDITGDMRGRIDAVADAVVGANMTRVFYVFDATDPTKPWTAGPGSFVDDLIRLAGGENVAAQAAGAWVQFSLEELVDSDPEIIMVDSFHGTAVISPEAIPGLAGWQDTTAARENRIYVVDGDLVNRTGPRIVQGLEVMASIIHPGLFGS